MSKKSRLLEIIKEGEKIRSNDVTIYLMYCNTNSKNRGFRFKHKEYSKDKIKYLIRFIKRRFTHDLHHKKHKNLVLVSAVAVLTPSQYTNEQIAYALKENRKYVLYNLY